MGLLRQKLLNTAPELHDCLLRSWTIANNEWLPALSAQMNSYNSYPHLRNLEDHLDRMAKDFEELPDGKPWLGLTPLEIYVLLVSVLLHDIGRITNPDKHGVESCETIKNKYAALGLPSTELAAIVGNICEYHEPPKDKNKYGKLLDRLRTVAIDPYGEIRQKEVACLLKLADHLDSAFVRVIPDYLLENFAAMEPVGAFRRVISGVSVDPRSRIIKTVIRDDISVKLPKGVKKYDNLIITNKSERTDELKQRLQGLAPVINQPFNKLTMTHEEWNALFAGSKKEVWEALEFRLVPPSLITGTANRKQFGCAELLIARQLAFIGKANKSEKAGWTSGLILAVVMGNLRENCEALSELTDDLVSMELPILAWVIEHREHLYNERGEETYEPVVDIEYLCQVAEAMWKLSSGIIGQTNFTYDSLASELRDDDVSRVKIAVRRISIVAEKLKAVNNVNSQSVTINKSYPMAAVRYGTDSWSWRVELPRSPEPSKLPLCRFVTLDKIHDALKNLSKPMERSK